MQGMLLVPILTALALLGAAAPASAADERAETGVAVAIGLDDSTLLVAGQAGFQLVVVEPRADIRAAGFGPMTLSDIRPGDRLDYAVSEWAGMVLADVVHVTPRRQAALQP